MTATLKKRYDSRSTGWLWIAIPVLAIATYVWVLRIGFLADDYTLIQATKNEGITLAGLLPSADWFFYRPVGNLLTWQINWQLWGWNPLPYHVAGLILHALTSLVVGLWVMEVSSSRRLGLLTGTLFAVYPLNMEAVGWIAAQPDAWAALFWTSSLWLFTLWWARQRRWIFYALALACYFLSVFSKESTFAMLPMLGLSAWMAARNAEPKPQRDGRALLLALLPFGAVLGLNLGLRYAAWGSIGGYEGVRRDYAHFIWDAVIAHARVLLSPVNAALFGMPTRQIVGLVTLALLLVAVAMYGRRQRRLLGLATVYIGLGLLPAINLLPQTEDLRNNRTYYLAAAGYCFAIAIFVRELIRDLSSAGTRYLARAGLSGLVVLSIGVCWMQLGPWHTATIQSLAVRDEMAHLLPTAWQPGTPNMVWYVKDIPSDYMGAQLIYVDLGTMMYLTTGQPILTQIVDDVRVLPPDPGEHEAFYMQFGYYPAEERFHPAYLGGITRGSEVPSGAAAGKDLRVWDFRKCDSADVNSWRFENTEYSCQPGNGLRLDPANEDPLMVSPDLTDPAVVRLDPAARYLRFRVAAMYPQGKSPNRVDWFWKTATLPFGESRRMGVPMREGGTPYTYWMLAPYTGKEGVQEAITQLRYDPAVGKVPSQILWIAVDTVE